VKADTEKLEAVFAQAECIFTLAEVEAALDVIIAQITADFSGKNPLVLGVMNGALACMGYMLPRLPFLLEMDYVHATRYQGKEEGSDLVRKRRPHVSMQGRHVILIDDILDCGITLAALQDYCQHAGAASVVIAVLGEKQIANHQAMVAADYVALKIPDRYVFGYGMDYQEYWRNAPGIFACK